jgi:hypothetical protein
MCIKAGRSGSSIKVSRKGTNLAAVALRVLLLEVPEISAHLLESFLRQEAELLLGLRGVGSQIGDVTGSTLSVVALSRGIYHCSPSADNLVLVLESGRLCHGGNHLEDAHALSSAQVERSVQPVFLGERGEDPIGFVERVEREDVAVCQVHDVEIVSDAGSITSRECLSMSPDVQLTGWGNRCRRL